MKNLSKLATQDIVVSNESDMLILVDSDDNEIGTSTKEFCHNGEGILHRAFSVFMFNANGELLLQQRSADKRLWPLFWSNSCCSHPRVGENIQQASLRRAYEELGVSSNNLQYLYKFYYQATFGSLGSEHELCSVYIGNTNDRIIANVNEVADWRFISAADLSQEVQVSPENFTPWFKMEWQKLTQDYAAELCAIGVNLEGVNLEGKPSVALKQAESYAEQSEDVSLSELDSTLDAALLWTAEQQNPEGFWNGILESNACLEAQWLMGLHVMGIDDAQKTAGFAQAIIDRQREDGSWEIYYDAPMGDPNATIESYAALRVAGYDPESPALSKARSWIFEVGALPKARVFTRYWLALIGEWPWQQVPNIPPEIIYFPKWFPFNIYNFASWARSTIMPLTLINAQRIVKPLPPEKRLDELFPDGRDKFDFSLPKKSNSGWSGFFYKADRVLHYLQEKGFTPWRKSATKKVINWILDHQDEDGTWGGIAPPWLYGIIALQANDYPLDHPVFEKGLNALNSHWTYTIDDGLYVQASESPVWDTLLTLLAIHECDAGETLKEPVCKAIDWILSKEHTAYGDWHQQTPHAKPGGWAFERANAMYPDVDDSAIAILALNGLKEHYHDSEAIDHAVQRAKDWILAMQCKNGGWGAFDRDNDKQLLTKIPFSDYGETLDPPSVDLAAHVIEALAPLSEQDPAIQTAIDAALVYIKSEQEDDGSWFGRWGVNYIYGIGAVLPALATVGEDMNQPYIRDAAKWIVDHQNDDGGWGETCASYMDDNLRGIGVSTASQTSWALLALNAVNHSDFNASINRGVSFLQETQVDGSWEEKQFTGTGFPGYGTGSRLDQEDQKRHIGLLQGKELGRGFMINYHMYRHYFPLIALGRIRRARNTD